MLALRRSEIWKFGNKTYVSIVRWQKTIFLGKCAISGNNHFFALLISHWCVDDTSLGWEVAIGLDFFKIQDGGQDHRHICISEHICCPRHSRMMILVSKCRLFMMRNPIIWLFCQFGAGFPCNSTIYVKFIIKWSLLFSVCNCSCR